jgi:3'-5' exonuclease
MNEYLDIETIPTQRPDIMAEIRDSLKADLDEKIAAIAPPGNYKKQETIDEWMATEAPKIRAKIESEFDAAVDEAYRKTALDGAFGQICVIGWAVDGDKVQRHYVRDLSLEEEANLLTDFMRWHDESDAMMTTVIGHHVSGFDLRYMAQRCMVHGIKPATVISRAAAAKPWESDRVYDTMIQWAGVGNRISLDKLCKALGVVSPKGDIAGKNVWDYVKAGKIAEVADYCVGDVEAVRRVHKRMTYRA